MYFHCTFLFSDPAEFELLVGKIITESHLVEKWFIVEGAYSFKGEFKGLRLKSLLKNDKRLTDYLNRIQVFEVHENLISESTAVEKFSDHVEGAARKLLGKSSGQIARSRVEKRFFEVEKSSRDIPMEEILKQTSPNDWLFITDVDEIINLSSEIVRNEVLAAVKTESNFLQIQRRRYVFDFDNLDPRFRTIPLIRISMIAGNSDLRISSFRFMNNGDTILMNLPPVIEFSYCFSYKDIQQKLRDFAHVAPSDSAVRDALMYNHHLRYSDDSEVNYFWFKKDNRVVEYIPMYFKQNINLLKTNSVNSDYNKLRCRDFPRYFTAREE